MRSLSGAATTLFARDLRVATNVTRPDGSRATGTPAPSHGFEPLQSAPIDPKDLIPLDDSELKQF